MATSMASASVAGDTTRSSSRIVPSSSTTPPAILVPPTSTPQARVIRRPPRARPRRCPRVSPGPRGPRRRRCARPRVARTACRVGRRRGGQHPGGRLQQRRGGDGEVAAHLGPAPGVRRAPCGRAGTRCTRRCRCRTCSLTSSVASRAQSERAPKSRTASSARLPTCSSGPGPGVSSSGGSLTASSPGRRPGPSSNLTCSSPCSTRAPATRCRAMPEGSVRRRRYDPTVTTSSSPLPREVDLGPGDERQRQSQHGARAVPGQPERPVAAGRGQRVVRAVHLAGELGERGHADGLPGAVDRAPHREPGEGLVDLGQHLVLRPHPAGPPVVARHPRGRPGWRRRRRRGSRTATASCRSGGPRPARRSRA